MSYISSLGFNTIIKKRIFPLVMVSQFSRTISNKSKLNLLKEKKKEIGRSLTHRSSLKMNDGALTIENMMLHHKVIEDFYFSNFSCKFLNLNDFSNLNYYCSSLLDMRNLQENKLKKHSVRGHFYIT